MTNLTDQLAEQETKRKAERRRTALHEAGHAVVAHLHGLDAQGLSVFALSDEGETRWQLSSVPVMGTPEDFARAVETIIVSDLAGQAAGIVFEFPNPKFGCRHDTENALTVARKFPEVARKHGSPERTYADALQTATSYIRKYKDVTDRFAGEIIKAGRLAGDDYREAMARAFGEETPFEVMVSRRRRFEELSGQGTPQDRAWAIAFHEHPDHRHEQASGAGSWVVNADGRTVRWVPIPRARR